MQLVWTIIRYELGRQFTRRTYLVATFGLPLVAILGFAAYIAIDSIDTSSGDSEPANEARTIEDELLETFEDYEPIGYIDQSGLFPPSDVVPFNTLVIQYDSESEAQRDLENGNIGSYFIIPANYLETGDVEAVANDFNLDLLNQTDLMESFILSVVVTDAETAEVYLRLQNPANITQHALETTGESRTINEDEQLAEFWLVYVFSLVLFISTMTSSGYLMQSVVEERESRMIEIILSSVKPMTLLFSKVLAMGLLGLLQVTLWISTATTLSVLAADRIEGLDTLEVRPYTVVVSLLCFLGAFLTMGSGSAAIGAISGSLRDGSQLLSVIVLPAVAPLWLLAVIAEDPNGTIAVVLSLFPLTAPLTVVMRASITTLSFIELIASFISMIGGALFFTWVAGRLFRVGVLLSGSSVPIGQAFRYIFERSPAMMQPKDTTSS